MTMCPGFNRRPKTLAQGEWNAYDDENGTIALQPGGGGIVSVNRTSGAFLQWLKSIGTHGQSCGASRVLFIGNRSGEESCDDQSLVQMLPTLIRNSANSGVVSRCHRSCTWLGPNATGLQTNSR